MAITFAQALAKYRPDQARDREGQWVDEGGGGGGRDAAAEFRARLKPQTRLVGRKKLLNDVLWSIRMAHVGDVASTTVGGSVPEFRAKQIADLRRFADELKRSIAQLESKPAKGSPTKSYAQRLRSAVSTTQLDLVIEAIRADRSMTVKRIEVLLGRRRTHLENTRAKLIDAVRRSAARDMLSAARRRALERVGV